MIDNLSPFGFKEALFFWKDAALVMTDSGGLQEETIDRVFPVGL